MGERTLFPEPALLEVSNTLLQAPRARALLRAAGEAGELLVGDEAAPLGSEPLHLGEQS